MPIDDPLTTDEALARRAGADFPLLLDPDQVYASGSDGAFASPASFDLTSASNAFAAQGVPVGAAVLVEREPAEADDRAESLWFAAVVTNPALTLRRKGLVPGAGVPPGRELGTTGVSFRVLSLEPQVRAASAALRARYRLDPADPYSPPGPSAAGLAEACVLLTLADRYLALAAVMAEQEDSFYAKSKEYRAVLDALLAELDELAARAALAAGSAGGLAHGRIRTGTDHGRCDTGIRLPFAPRGRNRFP